MILIDLNVILDVLQKREPHFAASSTVLEAVVERRVSAAIPAHAATTIHFIVSRYQDAKTADSAIDWLLRYFEIAGTGREELLRARSLCWKDFEDAVVAAAAESHGCKMLVTRNVKDFSESPVPAITPEEYLVSDAD